jgi:hypothetical protein
VVTNHGCPAHHNTTLSRPLPWARTATRWFEATLHGLNAFLLDSLWHGADMDSIPTGMEMGAYSVHPLGVCPTMPVLVQFDGLSVRMDRIPPE